MLKHLYIKNYALIEELDMDFQEGFSVITGETGAGKSILLGAIGLLLGQRADSKSIQTGASRCVIEAEFYLEGFGLETFFSENDFDYLDSQLILQDVAYYPVGRPSTGFKGVKFAEKTRKGVADILASLLGQATEGED